MSPHRIRLPAPWQATRLPGPAGSTEPESSVVFRRKFQRPSGLTDQSAIALEVALLEPRSLGVALNGKACALQRLSDVLFQVALSPDQLQPVNELEITVRAPASAGAVEQPKFGQDYLERVELILS